MKIAIAGGHSRAAKGASKYLDEYECDRAYVAKLIPALRAAGHTVVDCSNEKTTENAELAEEVRLANASGADLFLAVHFNSGGGTGTECFTYTYNTSQLAKDICAKMSANVANVLGLRNRGAKTDGFYVLRETNMPALLLEVCFVDSLADKAAWDRTSWEALTEAVVSAIGQTPVATGWQKDSKGWWYKNADGTYPANAWCKLGGYWYYFNAEGYAAKGWQMIKGEWYYLATSKTGNTPECAMLTGWIKDKEKWYYLEESGAMVRSCTMDIGGQTYAFDKSGVMFEGSVPTDKNGALILK